MDYPQIHGTIEQLVAAFHSLCGSPSSTLDHCLRLSVVSLALTAEPLVDIASMTCDLHACRVALRRVRRARGKPWSRRPCLG
jgi:hypothetical protein